MTEIAMKLPVRKRVTQAIGSGVLVRPAICQGAAATLK